MKAQPHPRQAERLKELHDLDVLDTDRERDFDDVVTLAADLCEAPISVINLIDADRQWFKAEVGLGVRETPLDTSLCAHAILERDFVEIPDMLLDARMQDNPLVKGGQGLRFYAGALLMTDQGLPIGTLCILDTKPRRLTDLQRRALGVLARQVMAQMKLRQSLRQAEAMRQEADHRVKNSLQAVASLIGVQARRADPAVRAALDQVSRQIRSVATLHAMLNQHQGVEAVALRPYAEGIGAILGDSLPANLTVTVEAAPVMVTPAQAAAIGTIMNEFASNAAKHAFPDARTGQVRFSIKPQDDTTLRFVCADDGIGFDWDGVDRNASLGLRVMMATAESLGGTLQSEDRGTGSVLALTFGLDQEINPD
ncbi:histidine kinase dimerization/phosphoacceptor domain -containing protein [uncultured Paracoccus sp.]|uniref:sensor histidine kinase n=1 Tax=uncultured Paracoccus sp. TaxID=189685 RepID=UPI0025ECA670|nr:histidine kinase dimerization/phosphoacceptor domain -containing protein [uncultured Paracoccus sp.]